MRAFFLICGRKECLWVANVNYEARKLQNGDVPISDTDTPRIRIHGVLKLIILI